MATIRVLHGKDRQIDYEGADRWVIDPEGRLHIVGGSSGNLASFNRELWQSVEFIPPKDAE